MISTITSVFFGKKPVYNKEEKAVSSTIENNEKEVDNLLNSILPQGTLAVPATCEEALAFFQEKDNCEDWGASIDDIGTNSSCVIKITNRNLVLDLCGKAGTFVSCYLHYRANRLSKVKAHHHCVPDVSYAKDIFVTGMNDLYDTNGLEVLAKDHASMATYIYMDSEEPPKGVASYYKDTNVLAITYYTGRLPEHSIRFKNRTV